MTKPRPVPHYADLMTLAEFERACRAGSFVNSDGHGYYVRDGMMFGSATPSMIRNGIVDRTATHVAWFNK